jgi:hypothetical protein
MLESNLSAAGGLAGSDAVIGIALFTSLPGKRKAKNSGGLGAEPPMPVIKQRCFPPG